MNTNILPLELNSTIKPINQSIQNFFSNPPTSQLNEESAM